MRIWSALLALLISSAWCAEPVAPQPAPTDSEIERQVRLLGSDEFSEREAAHRAVEKYEVAAEDFLIQAMKSEDAEVRSRVERLLRKVHWIKRCNEDASWLSKLGPTLGTSRPGDAARLAAESDSAEAPVNEDERAWLARTQEADGHWDSKKYGAQTDADIEQTAFAALAFLGAGHSERSGMYKRNVTNALAWLRAQQREDGSFAKPGQPVDGIAHAIAGIAMAEAAGMAKNRDTRDSAQRAVVYSTEKHQARIGEALSGFVRVAGSAEPDLFTTLFFAMQLKSTKIAGLKVPIEAFEGEVAFLKSCEAPEGKGYSFLPGQKPTPKATFTGCLTAMFVGYSKADLEKAVAYAFEGFQPTVGEKYSDPLLMYVGSLVVFSCDSRNPFNLNGADGNRLWPLWQKPMQDALISQQIKSGANAGSWNPAGTWASGGRVLTTALHSLCLEIYYRYARLNSN